MKYDSMRKLERNESLCRLHIERKDLSLAELGKFFGISKQRVSKILKGAKMDNVRKAEILNLLGFPQIRGGWNSYYVMHPAELKEIQDTIVEMYEALKATIWCIQHRDMEGGIGWGQLEKDVQEALAKAEGK